MIDIPYGWIIVPFGDLGEIKLGKMLDAVKNFGEPTQYLRNINIRWGEFDLTDVSMMRMNDVERELLQIRDGDLLICEGGEPGRCAVWANGENDLTFQKALLRVRANDAVNPYWLSNYLRHLANNKTLDQYMTGTTIKHLPQVALSRIPVPMPPSSEQDRIVDKLGRLSIRLRQARDELRHVGRLSGELGTGQQLLDRLDQTILSKAFCGELAPQDPNDEPASVLLERIRAKRAAAGPAPKRGRRPRGVAA